MFGISNREFSLMNLRALSLSPCKREVIAGEDNSLRHLEVKYAHRHHLASAMMVFCLAITVTFPALADDTEIYLGRQASTGDETHNVLFIFDTSRSMQQNVTVDDNGDGDTDDPGENRGTRIAILKQVIDETIQGLSNLNVGYMRMNGSRTPNSANAAATNCNDTTTVLTTTVEPFLQDRSAQQIGTAAVQKPNPSNLCYVPSGGTVLFPVSDLGEDIANIPGATTSSIVRTSVSGNAGDAQQASALGSPLIIDGNRLNIGADQCVGKLLTQSYPVVNTFDDLRDQVTISGIFQGVATGEASLELGSQLTSFRFTNMSLPQGTPIIEAFVEFSTVGTDSGVLDTFIDGVANGFTGNPFARISTLPRTSTVVDWTGVPETTVSTTTLTTPDISGIIQELIDAGDWGFEVKIVVANTATVFSQRRQVRTFEAGAPAVLQLTYCDDPFTSQQRQEIGLNFESVGIPQGAEIVSAFVDFTAGVDALNSSISPIEVVSIAADDVDNSPAFDVQDIQSRTTTLATVSWDGDQMGNWDRDNSYSTPDITAVVQAIVDRPGWCGGNSMSLIFDSQTDDLLRTAISYDADASAAAVLRVEYNDIYDSADSACNRREYSLPVIANKHDAWTTGLASSTEGGNNAGIELHPGGQAGFIFTLPVIQGAEIDSAMLQLRPELNSNNTTGSLNVSITVEDSANASQFYNQIGNLDPTNRPRFIPAEGAISWDIAGVTSINDIFPNQPNLAPLLNEIVSKPDWQYDNNVAILLGINGGTARFIRSFENSPSLSARLRLLVRENRTTSGPVTVRDRLLQINEGFRRTNLLYWTPSVETLFEAALYWRGKDVQFGRTRGAADLGIRNLVNRRSGGIQTADIDFTLDMNRTLTSHPGSWTGGVYNEPPGHDLGLGSCQFSNAPGCEEDSISGSATYVSPISNAGGECSANYQIFLTDGAPTWVTQGTIDMITNEFAGINSCSVDPAVNARTDRGQCAVEIISALNQQDQNPDVDGEQTVITHTIAFNLTNNTSVTWLEQLAAAGGGLFFSASDTSSLQSSLNQILDVIVQRPSTFVAPSVSANAFNRLFSRDEIYFGLFEAEPVAGWDGNVKKYNICDQTDPDGDGTADCVLGDILDSELNVAVINGVFVEESTSVWSSQEDGNRLRAGGAGAVLQDVSDRVIYTDLDNTGSTTTGPLNTDGWEIDTSDWSNTDLSHVHNLVCPDPTDLSPGSDCEDRIFWMLGQDRQDEDGDGNVSEVRWWFSDVLHSSPVSVTYGMDEMDPNDPEDDIFIDKILVGTNDGGVHMINGYAGNEEWTFIPNELLDNQIILYTNPAADHVYGMDLTPVVRIVDRNGNGIIEPPADMVHAYLGMRRGGTSYYALDISPDNTLVSEGTKIVPKLLWTIEGGTSGTQGDFTRLAQTWSEPVLATIACAGGGSCSNGQMEALIFGGGYDDRLDDDNFGLAAAAPNLGNAVYIVAADTGQLVTWISHASAVADTANNIPAIAASGADIEVPGMYYSIMSRLTVIDSDANGIDDRIYFGDAGGQLWRIDLGDNIGDLTSPEGSTVVGQLAGISTAGVLADQRRFHYHPSVAQVIDMEYSQAAGGEFDYIVIASGDRASPLNRDVQDRLYAFRDHHIAPMSGTNGLATSYPSGTTGNQPITEANMVDITNQVLDSTDISHVQSLGWYYRFDTGGTNNGQKGIAPPTIITGNVLITSYLPADPDTTFVSACGSLEGNGIAHNFNLLTSAAALDWDGDGDINPTGDRTQDLGAGIPSAVIPIFTREGVTISVGTGAGPENLGRVTGLPRYRTYWYDDLPTN